MAAVNMLRRLTVREVRFLQELEEGYHYEVVGVDRVTVDRHHWCVVHLKGDAITKVVIEKMFKEPEELLVCMGAIECAGLEWSQPYRGLHLEFYDTMVGQLYEK